MPEKNSSNNNPYNNSEAESNNKFWLPLLLSFTMVAGIFVGRKMNNIPLISVSSSEPTELTAINQIGSVEEIIRYIDVQYVDETDRDKMVETAIGSILKDLDPHSSYISAKELKSVNEQLDGNFDGVGIEFMILEDTILVVSPISGGPSEEVGIMAGDKIVQIEDSIVAGKKLAVKDVVSMLKGERGTDVRVGIKRGKENDLRSFMITRDAIPLHSVDVACMLDKETGYIKISRFSATTYREFMEKLEGLVKEKNLKNLVIDVRQNPGGYLQEATNILSQLFKDDDKLLVYTKGSTSRRSEYESTGRVFYNIDSLAVLIDEGSASASEIVAGAVQDWDRGAVVGRRSFGKGLVQEQYDLQDGGALRLTVARYYTPSGRCIQKSYQDLENYDHDVYTRMKSGELINEDSILVRDTTEKFYTANGRIVYAGGGITPDIFVPIDTTMFNDYYIKLRKHIPAFVYRFVESNKSRLNFSLEEFLDGFTVDEATLDSFLLYAEEKGVERNPTELKTIKNAVKMLFKARVARYLYKEEGYYGVINREDEVVQAALQSIYSSDFGPVVSKMNN